MFVKNGEDADRKRLEQGLRAAQADLANSDDHGDRARARADIARLERKLRAR